MQNRPAPGDAAVLGSDDDVAAHLQAICFDPSPEADVVGRVGLEAEVFVVHREGQRRTALEELVDVVSGTDGIAAVEGVDRPAWTAPEGRLTEEPGGQLELITNPEPTLAASIDRIDALAERLAGPLEAAGLATVGTGLDPFNADDGLEVQLESPRYTAMGSYFARRGTNGHALMCASASLQVNLDLGPPAMARRRWLLANLAAPVVVATFANSPTGEAVNGRALAWMRLDPTRTGVPAIIAVGVDDPVAHLQWDVMRADVMLVRRRGMVLAGRPGFSFGDWVRHGHPRHGQPTQADLELHLSTLFPEVRLRGFLEVRGPDQLPRRWRPAPAVLLTGLLYDDTATREGLALLEEARRDLPRLQDRAVRRGLTDPLVWRLAGPLWDIALAGAERLGPEWVGERWLTCAAEYLARFTSRRHHPADEQRELRRRGRDAALVWAA